MPSALDVAVQAGLLHPDNARAFAQQNDSKPRAIVYRLVYEQLVDDIRLAGALASAAQVPLVNSADIAVDPEALALLPSELARQRYTLPLHLREESQERILRVAVADPLQATIVAQLQELTDCSIELSVMPLRLLIDLIERNYQGLSTLVVPRPQPTDFADNLFVTRKQRTSSGRIPIPVVDETGEISVTAQVHLSVLGNARVDWGQPAANWRELDLRVRGLYQILLQKGFVNETEVALAIAALRKADNEDGT